MSDPYLKPCPFCGNTELTIKPNGIGDYYVVCDSQYDETRGCGAQTSDVRCESQHHAAERWNTRYISQGGFGFSIKNVRGLSAVELIRGVFEPSVRRSKFLRKRFAKFLKPREENGKFAGYCHAMFDCFWVGFALGWRGRERYALQQKERYDESSKN